MTTRPADDDARDHDSRLPRAGAHDAPRGRVESGEPPAVPAADQDGGVRRARRAGEGGGDGGARGLGRLAGIEGRGDLARRGVARRLGSARPVPQIAGRCRRNRPSSQNPANHVGSGGLSRASGVRPASTSASNSATSARGLTPRPPARPKRRSCLWRGDKPHCRRRRIQQRNELRRYAPTEGPGIIARAGSGRRRGGRRRGRAGAVRWRGRCTPGGGPPLRRRDIGARTDSRRAARSRTRPRRRRRCRPCVRPPGCASRPATTHRIDV